MRVRIIKTTRVSGLPSPQLSVCRNFVHDYGLGAMVYVTQNLKSLSKNCDR